MFKSVDFWVKQILSIMLVDLVQITEGLNRTKTDLFSKMKEFYQQMAFSPEMLHWVFPGLQPVCYRLASLAIARTTLIYLPPRPKPPCSVFVYMYTHPVGSLFLENLIQWVTVEVENRHTWIWRVAKTFVCVIWNTCLLKDSDFSVWWHCLSACFESFL